jgi:hypothetical protein
MTNIKKSTALKCKELFPYGIRIGTPITINFSSGANDEFMSRAVSAHCPPQSFERDGQGQDRDFYHASRQGGSYSFNSPSVKNGSSGTISYIAVASNGEPYFHVYIDSVEIEVYCTLEDFGIYDDSDSFESESTSDLN